MLANHVVMWNVGNVWNVSVKENAHMYENVMCLRAVVLCIVVLVSSWKLLIAAFG